MLCAKCIQPHGKFEIHAYEPYTERLPTRQAVRWPKQFFQIRSQPGELGYIALASYFAARRLWQEEQLSPLQSP